MPSGKDRFPDKKMPLEKLEPTPILQDLGEIRRRLHMNQRGDWSHVETLIEIAQPLIQPKAVYKVSCIESKLEDGVMIDGIRLTSGVLRKQLDEVERVFPYVVSIGNQLEEQIRNCSDLLDQYYLDVIGNVALSTVRKHLERTLMSKYGLDGCLSSMAPGSLEDWPIEEQKPLFLILGDVETSIGVRITEHLLMVPTKSISGIYFPTEIPFVSCSLCPRKRCGSRKADFDEKLVRESNIQIFNHQDSH
jgi:hypothetical protein